MREIRWTSESEAHVARRGVTPEEVEQTVNSRPRYEASDREDSTLLYCATDDGRPLLVVLAEALDGRWCVATARDMNGHRAPYLPAEGKVSHGRADEVATTRRVLRHPRHQ